MPLRASLLALLGLSFCWTAWSDQVLGLGTPATPEQIARLDTDVDARGRGLPPGRGDVPGGQQVYEQQCLVCHGRDGRQGSVKILAPLDGQPPPNERSIRNWWPYATTLFDYIRRAMPEGAAGSLSDDEVYAVTAYLLYREGLIGSDITLGPENLPGISMPAASRFQPVSAPASGKRQ